MRQTAITFALVLIAITIHAASSPAASDDDRALQGLRALAAIGHHRWHWAWASSGWQAQPMG